MKDFENIFQQTVELLKQMSIRHEYTRFSSGAIMLDVWLKGKFYVFQFERDYIGLSEINENVGFDTVPDKKFTNQSSYLKELKCLLKSN